MTTALGLLLVVLAGLGTGTIAWPMKMMKRFRFEHYWFVAMLAGLVLIPWIVVLSSVSRPFAAYGQVPWPTLVKSNLFGIGWGIANVLYGVSVVRIGAALTGAILTGLGIAVGVTLPMLYKASGLFRDAPGLGSPAGLAVMAGLVVMLAGVVIVSMAGFGRERAMAGSPAAPARSSRGFLGSLVMCAAAGVLSAGSSFSFIYSQGPIVEAMKARGAGDLAANMAVWAAALSGGALVNVLYPAWIMTRDRSWALLKSGGRDLVLAAALGAQFILSVNLLGRGMVLLGALGASIGFGIQQAMQLLGNQAVGFLSGEWHGVRGTPLRQMIASLAVILAAVAIMAYGKALTP